MKIVNIDGENPIFWTTWGILMKFSENMWLMITLKVTKNQGFVLSFTNTLLVKILVTVLCMWASKWVFPKENHQFSGKWTLSYILKLSCRDVTRANSHFLLGPLDYFVRWLCFINIFKEVRRLSAAAQFCNYIVKHWQNCSHINKIRYKNLAIIMVSRTPVIGFMDKNFCM